MVKAVLTNIQIKRNIEILDGLAHTYFYTHLDNPARVQRHTPTPGSVQYSFGAFAEQIILNKLDDNFTEITIIPAAESLHDGHLTPEELADNPPYAGVPKPENEEAREKSIAYHARQIEGVMALREKHQKIIFELLDSLTRKGDKGDATIQMLVERASKLTTAPVGSEGIIGRDTKASVLGGTFATSWLEDGTKVVIAHFHPDNESLISDTLQSTDYPLKVTEGYLLGQTEITQELKSELPRGKPRNADDDWAWEQVHIHKRLRNEVYGEWLERIGNRGQILADAKDSFGKAVSKKRGNKRKNG